MFSNTERDKDSNHDLENSTADLLGSIRERRFLRKLDVCLITWAWFAYLIKLIDASNYKTAYASGMMEDLNFQGNQLNYLDTFYRIGYALFLIPSQLILTRIRPSLWLPALELLWGVMTGLMAATSSVKSMYVLRFFIGVFEASSYPGIICVLCNWYTPREIATRIAIFGTSYPASSIFVSFMQAALHKTMDGKGGLAGWKWLFVFNALMTVVVAATGFFLIPDSPGETKAFWMTKSDNEISRSRMDRVHKLPPTRLSLRTIKNTVSGWVLYIFTFAYAFWSWSQNSNTWIVLFLKAAKNADGTKRFTVSQLNAIPIGGYVLQIVAMLVFAWLSSRTGWRATWIIIQEITLLIGAIILSVWPASFATKMVGYFMLWLSNAAGPILIAWMADHCPSPEERAVIIGISVTFVYIIDAWANIFIYPAVEAPNYRVGYKAAAAFAFACIIFTLAFKWFASREQAPEQKEDEMETQTSSQAASQRPSQDEKVDVSGNYDPQPPYGSRS